MVTISLKLTDSDRWPTYTSALLLDCLVGWLDVLWWAGILPMSAWTGGSWRHLHFCKEHTTWWINDKNTH